MATDQTQTTPPVLPWIEYDDGSWRVDLDGDDDADPGERFVLISPPGSTNRLLSDDPDGEDFYWEITSEDGSDGYSARTLEEAQAAAEQAAFDDGYRAKGSLT